MKSKFLYLLVFVGFLIPAGINSLSAADSTGIDNADSQVKTDVQKTKLVNRGEGEGDGEGQGGEGGEEGDQDKKKAKEKIKIEKARLAKAEESSFGMLKDLFQSTFDYFYAPDSTKSDEIVQQKR